MKNTDNFFDFIKNNVNELELPYYDIIDSLDNNAPFIYLCGKSSTGKTTFLNAFLGLERDELFVSTNVSTKSRFNFNYAEKNHIKLGDGSTIQLPDEVLERKQIFKSFNDKEEVLDVYLNKDILKDRIIVDIPGVLDYKRDVSFYERMISEADLILFFTQATGKISNEEYVLLQSINDLKIPLFVVFTMADMTEPDEGITRKTIPKIVEDRLNTCFNGINVYNYQIISSNDYYKGKDDNGIDDLQDELKKSHLQFFDLSKRNKAKRVFDHYIAIIQNRLNEFTSEKDNLNELSKRKIELQFKEKYREIEKNKNSFEVSIVSDLELILNEVKSSLFSSVLKRSNVSENDDYEKEKSNFIKKWNNAWQEITNQYKEYNIAIPILPIVGNDILSPINLDLEKLRMLLAKKSNNKDDNSNKEKETNKKEKSIKEMSWFEKGEVLVELGLNIGNGKILYKKYTYYQEVENIIKTSKMEILESMNIYFNIKKNELINNQKIDLENIIINNPLCDKINQLQDFKTQLEEIYAK